MALPWDRREFRSWRKALDDKALNAEQLALLREMTEKGQAASLEAAAELLDWQEGVVDADEHMYGL